MPRRSIYAGITEDVDMDEDENYIPSARDEGVPGSIVLKCGPVAVFDHSSGCGYRCTACFAVAGSVGACDDSIEDKERTEERRNKFKTILERSSK